MELKDCQVHSMLQFGINPKDKIKDNNFIIHRNIKGLDNLNLIRHNQRWYLTELIKANKTDNNYSITFNIIREVEENEINKSLFS